MIADVVKSDTNPLVQLFNRKDKIIVMGVINVTPDSFSDGGRYFEPDDAVKRALEMIDEGADILDIGGESSRPGSDPVPADEQIKRILPVVTGICHNTSVPVSIDTTSAKVAEAALSAGAIVVNDISALEDDPAMQEIVAGLDAGLILMHKRGNPKYMQKDTSYRNLIEEIVEFLRGALKKAVAAGVDFSKIIIDPGIGFGKDAEGNLEIIRSIARFTELGRPIMIGASRKSFIGAVTGAPVAERLPGSLAAITATVLSGVSAVRVHDVKEARQAVDLAIKLR